VKQDKHTATGSGHRLAFSSVPSPDNAARTPIASDISRDTVHRVFACNDCGDVIANEFKGYGARLLSKGKRRRHAWQRQVVKSTEHRA